MLQVASVTRGLPHHSCCIFNFGDILPDAFLHRPLTSEKLSLIRHISYHSRLIFGRPEYLRCNRLLLHDALTASITDGCHDAFFALLTVDAVLSPHEGCVVDFVHVNCAVVSGRIFMLMVVLRRLRVGPPTWSTNPEVLGLIERAKGSEYPNWKESTQILELEVQRYV